MEITGNYGRGLSDVLNPGTGQVESKALDQQDFLRIMVEQMRQQNPLEPMDNTQFFQQMAQFETLDAMREISTALQSMAAVSELANASTLVGRTVKATIPGGIDPETGFPTAPEDLTGAVERVTFSPSGPVVHIGTRQVPAALITEVAA